MSTVGLFQVGFGLSGLAFSVRGPLMVPYMQGREPTSPIIFAPMGNENLRCFTDFVGRAAIVSDTAEKATCSMMTRWGTCELRSPTSDDDDRDNVTAVVSPIYETENDSLGAEFDARVIEGERARLFARLSYRLPAIQFDITQTSMMGAQFLDTGELISDSSDGVSMILISSGARFFSHVLDNHRGEVMWSRVGESIPHNVTPLTAFRLASVFLGSRQGEAAGRGRERMKLSAYSKGFTEVKEIELMDEAGVLEYSDEVRRLLAPHDIVVRVSLEGERAGAGSDVHEDYGPRFAVWYVPEMPDYGVRHIHSPRRLKYPSITVSETVTFGTRGTQQFSNLVANLVSAAAAMRPDIFPTWR